MTAAQFQTGSQSNDAAKAAQAALGPDTAAKSMAGKVCLITGATGGIGLITAQVLAAQGARLVLVSRSVQKCEATVAQIKASTGNDQISFIAGDLSLMAQVRQVAEQFLAQNDRLDVLINNAGAVFSSRQVTAEGYEMTMALNHLNYFYLTQLLQDVLLASAPARIVNVSSDAHKGGSIKFDDLMSEKKYSAFGVYSMSKLANVMFTYELARRLEDSGVTANALHPGFVASNFGRSNGGIWGAIMPLGPEVCHHPRERRGDDHLPGGFARRRRCDRQVLRQAAAGQVVGRILRPGRPTPPLGHERPVGPAGCEDMRTNVPGTGERKRSHDVPGTLLHPSYAVLHRAIRRQADIA